MRGRIKGAGSRVTSWKLLRLGADTDQIIQVHYVGALREASHLGPSPLMGRQCHLYSMVRKHWVSLSHGLRFPMKWTCV